VELWLEIRWDEVPSSIPERKAPRNLTIHKIKADTLDDPQKRAMAWRAYKKERVKGWQD